MILPFYHRMGPSKRLPSVSFVTLLLGVLLIRGAFPLPAAAEFLRTAKPAVYQHTTALGLKVIGVPEYTNDGIPGIFIYHGEPVEFQFFHPSLMDSKHATHLFIAYDPRRNRYSEVYFGKKRYKLTGNATLLLEHYLRVTIDAQNNSTPYLSIVRDKENEEPSILGFQGTKVIVNATGNEAVALLEANTLHGLSNVLFPYVVRNGRVSVKGKEVTTKTLGLALEQARNPCLLDNAVLLEHVELTRIGNNPSRRHRKKLLGALLEKNQYGNAPSSWLVLRVNEKSVIALNYLTGIVHIIRSYRTDGKTPICSVEDVVLG